MRCEASEASWGIAVERVNVVRCSDICQIMYFPIHNLISEFFFKHMKILVPEVESYLEGIKDRDTRYLLLTGRKGISC